jgi:mono/diheme cytochrome c family protein
MHLAGPIAVVLLLVSSPAPAQETQRGRALYETQCATCHSERLHEREKSRIRSISELRAEVIRWSRETRQHFTAEDIEDVVRFLNRTHYRLEK